MLGWSAVLPQFANSSLLTILLHIVLYCWHLRESQLTYGSYQTSSMPAWLWRKNSDIWAKCKHQPCQPWVQGECTRLIPRDSEASSRKIGWLTVWLQPSHWVYIQDNSNAVDRFWLRCRGSRRSEEDQLIRDAASLLIGRSHNCTKSFIFHSFGDCVDNLIPMRIAEQRIVFC